MIIKNEISSVAAVVPTAVALFLAALFVGLTLLLAFWGKRRKARRLRKAKRSHKGIDPVWFWGFFVFVGFAAFILALDLRY